MPGTCSASRKDPDSNKIESEICESLVIPTEITNANATSQSTTSLAQGDLIQEYGRKFAEHLDDQKLSKRCSDAGFFNEIGEGQFFITIEEGSEVMQTACREYTDLKTSRPKEWTRSNTQIGPVLDVKLYPHEGRYCIDIMIESLLKDQTVSWVRIVNGINKHVTQTSEEISIENVQQFISTGRPVAQAKPRLTVVLQCRIKIHDQNTAT